MRSRMSPRVLIPIVAAVALLAVLRLSSTGAVGQGRQGAGGRGARTAATPAGPVPKSLDGHADFTGVYNAHGSEDIRDTLAPGSEITFTPAGAAKYKTQDYAQDPDSRCLPG